MKRSNLLAGLMTVILLTFTAGPASAGILIEPFIGYEMGEHDGGTEKDDASGTTLGGRLGFTMLGFMAGAEYSIANLTVERSGGDVDYDLKDMGIFVGFEFPVMFRVYGTYFFSTEAKSNTEKLEGSSGYRLGVGYTGLPFVALNLEMVSRTYDERDGADIAGDDESIDSTVFTVSIPLP